MIYLFFFSTQKRRCQRRFFLPTVPSRDPIQETAEKPPSEVPNPRWPEFKNPPTQLEVIDNSNLWVRVNHKSPGDSIN